MERKSGMSFKKLIAAAFLIFGACLYVPVSSADDQQNLRIGDDGPAPVPAPATLALFGLGVVGLLAAKKRR